MFISMENTQKSNSSCFLSTPFLTPKRLWFGVSFQNPFLLHAYKLSEYEQHSFFPPSRYQERRGSTGRQFPSLRVWKHVVQKGDTVVDATCGNGHDTLAMLQLVKDDSDHGYVYGFDIQEDAINNTFSLLDMSLRPSERKFVKLFATCHSRMMQVLPKGISVRLVAFNLGYLPGSDKTIITKSNTTLLALEAAKEMLVSGGLISAVVYVGHPGGREEFETVLGFASGLSAEEWTCTQIQMLNRPSAPILVFLFKR